ncbi:hypothetical protein U3A58_17340 [Algoriphagus sp. C2-6-M1]|uniref:hypothetical protein n=1 Tax=Algoriphagus persicinus TaxID=3108754 RepID=UPI002B3ACAE9|nr:hypothetical protein [Algoriphagus sp. C2-6-M1]MEB2782160.1 hypothetical protein [Algoriphagus sp. C2-6-M1]
MEFITEKGEEFILVTDQTHLEELITRISEGEQFAYQFKFSERDFFIKLLGSLRINYEDFTTKYYHFDANRRLHISESEFGYVWISTVGLIAKNKSTTNRAVNSCLNQHTVISMLLKESIEVVQDERVYDIDSYKFGLLANLSPAIYHNLAFYVEVFCKAYLSLTGTQAPKSHKLSLIYQKTVEAMISKSHNDSLFQISVLDPLYSFVDHLGKIPGDFKEHFIKYDDNPQDDTVILFEVPKLIEMTYLLELSADFISDYYYMGADTYYLRSNVYQRMLDKADTEEKKARVQALYPHLAKNIKFPNT